MEKLIATFAKNATEEVRVSLTQFRGHDLVDVRVYFEPRGGDEKLPSKKGVCLGVDLLPDLRAALAGAEKAARGAGLIETETVGAPGGDQA